MAFSTVGFGVESRVSGVRVSFLAKSGVPYAKKQFECMMKHSLGDAEWLAFLATLMDVEDAQR